MTRSRRAAAVLLALACAASACSQKGGQAPASTTSRSTTSGSASTSTAGPTSTTGSGSSTGASWTSCDDGYQCSSILVPVDYAKPNGRKIRIAMARRPAKDQAHKIGSLLMDPGGPGASAIDFIEALPLPSALTDRFDIVGFDPRGVGRSHPLNCRTYLQKMYDDDPSPDTPAETEQYLADSRSFVDECKAKYASLLPHLGTRDVARDMDQVRQALGEQKISYVGFSYGTSIGQAYAAQFPTHVRAMVLDGSVNLAEDGLQGAQGQAAGFSLALDDFAKNCDTTTDCGLGAPALTVIDRVIAKAEAKPINTHGVDRKAGPGVLNLALAQGLYSDQLWPELARALHQADGGNGTGLVRLADAYLERNVDGTYPNGFEIYFAVSCLDQSFPRDPAAILAAAKAVGKRYPEFGEGLVNDYVRCAYWPTPAQPLHPVPATTKGLPTIVVISTTGDPATPYANGVAVAKQIPGARLITNHGEGHTIFSQGKACIDDPVTAYLVDLTPPKVGLSCPES